MSGVAAAVFDPIRPGDKAVQTDGSIDGLDNDALHASATVNTAANSLIDSLDQNRYTMKSKPLFVTGGPNRSSL